MARANMAAFNYQGGKLYCDAIPLETIAQDYGTPTYIYSGAELHKSARTYRDVSRRYNENALVCYAVKANGNPALLNILATTGLGADIVSGGELFLAIDAGFSPNHIVFSGVGKTRQEIGEALSAGILAIHLESEGEMDLVTEVASSMNRVAAVSVRVNPDIAVGTHAHVATGQQKHKFGVSPEIALSMMRGAEASSWLRPMGLSAHLGSQIASLDPFREAAERLVAMADRLSSEGVSLQYLDLGGGLAIDYGQGSGPSINQWIEAISEPIARRGYRLLVEPGRSIVGPAGALLTRVLYTKNQAGQAMAIADAGMNDLMRPALYGAQHPILPVVEPVDDDEYGVDVVGPVCETSDVLAKGRSLPGLAGGDLLAILQAGAYGFAMSSNYNGRPRPAEVLVEGDEVRVIRRRESYADLLAGTTRD